MKLTKYIAGLSVFAFTVAANAVTINVTGATAFRSATLNTIKAQYAASGVAFQYAHNAAAGSVGSANYAIFTGTYPGIGANTTIRCTFSGSVEGLRSLALGNADPAKPVYLKSSVFSTAAAVGGGETATLATPVLGSTGENDTSSLSLSDVDSPASPYASYASAFTTAPIGVIVFTMMTNNGSTITNVTGQHYRALLTNGYQPKSLFTGNAADASLVFPIGRNDLSGTRTTALAETGFGISNPVKQYVQSSASGANLTAIKLVKGTTGSNTDSTVWGQNVDGNGGYNSGSNVSGVLSLGCQNVAVQDATGAELIAAAGNPVDLVTWLGISDASVAKNNGAVLCGYNGVSLDLGVVASTTTANATALVAGTHYTIKTAGTTNFTVFGAANSNVGTQFTASRAGTAGNGTTIPSDGTGTCTVNNYVMSDNDKAKIANGAYTAWGWERIFRNSNDANVTALYNNLLANVPANIGTAGMKITDMAVGRSTDGGLVAP